MIDYNSAINALSSQVKFQKTNQPKTPQIADDLIYDSMGNSIIFNEIEEGKTFLTNEYIYRTVEQFRDEIIRNYKAWDENTLYQEGDFVCQDDDNNNIYAYVAREQNENVNPTEDTNDLWESDLSFYLRQIRNQSIIQLINEVTTSRNVLGHVKDVLEITPLFGQYRDREIIDNFYIPPNDPPLPDDPTPISKGRGFQIEQSQTNHIQTHITELGLICDTAQDIKFYVYHSSQVDPINEFSIKVLQGSENKFIWYDLDCDVILNFNDSRYNAGGYFRILYYDQDLLEGSKVIGFNSLYSVYQNRLELNTIYPTDMDYDLDNYPQNPPIDTYNVSSNTPFNLKIKTLTNYLYSVEQHPAMWQKALQYKMATSVFSDMLSSTRLSKENNQIYKSMNMVLKGSFTEQGTEVHKGLYSRTEEYSKMIEINLEDLDDICLRQQNIALYQY